MANSMRSSFTPAPGVQAGDDVAERALERLLGREVDGRRRQREEALDGVVGVLRMAGDLDVGDGMDVERDAPVGEHLRSPPSSVGMRRMSIRVTVCRKGTRQCEPDWMTV